MKRILFSLLFLVASEILAAQPVTSLFENFNAACAVTYGLPSGWMKYNPMSATVPNGEWTCTPSDGRPASGGSPTPGIQCSGIWSSTYHLDTSYLITPLLDFSSYSGSVFLRFDTKTTNIYLGGELHLIKSIDTIIGSPSDSDFSSFMMPVIGVGDSSDWVTHEIDLTTHAHTGMFYLAFRYTSLNTTGSIWYLDNVSTSSTSLFVHPVISNNIPVSIVGSASRTHVDIAFTSNGAATYSIGLYDMLGRQIFSSDLKAHGGAETYSISNIDLVPGMYFVKMANGNVYGATKILIR